MKKPAHTKLESKAVNQAALQSKAPKAHKAISEKEVAHAALYSDLKHHDLALDVSLNSADVDTLKQLEKDQANWIATDDQDEATISIAYHDATDSINNNLQPSADLYAFDTQWSQAQLDSINSHIDASVNAATQPLWTLLLGGAVVGGIALAVSGGGGGGGEAPVAYSLFAPDSQLFEDFCNSVALRPDYYTISHQNDYYITSNSTRSDVVGSASNQTYDIGFDLGGHDFGNATAGGIAFVLQGTGGYGEDAAVHVNATAADTESNAIWMNRLTIESSGDAAHFGGSVNVSASAQSGSASAEIGICAINVDMFAARTDAQAEAYVHAAAGAPTSDPAGGLAQIFVHEINLHASVSGYHILHAPYYSGYSDMTAYVGAAFVAQAYYTNAQAYVEIGDIHMVAEINSNVNHENNSTYARATIDAIAATTSDPQEIAALSINSITVTASNHDGYDYNGGNYASVVLDYSYNNLLNENLPSEFGRAITANAGYSNDIAYVDIGDINLTAKAEGTAYVEVWGLGAVASDLNALATVTIGDISLNVDSTTGTGYAALGIGYRNSYYSYGHDLPNVSSYQTGFNITAYASGTNAQANITIGNISVNAEGYDSAYASLTSMTAYAGNYSNEVASVAVGDITVTALAKQSDGYAYFNGVSADAQGTNAEVNISLGDVTISASGYSYAYAIFDGATAYAGNTGASADVTIGDINISAVAVNDTGYAYFNARAEASASDTHAEITIGNINLTAQAQDNATVSLDEIWASVSYSSGTIANAYANITVGDISLKADSVSYSASGYINYLGASISASNAYHNIASVTIGDVSIAAGGTMAADGSDAAAQMYEISAYMNASNSATGNLVSVTLGDVTISARSQWDSASGYVSYIGAVQESSVTLGEDENYHPSLFNDNTNEFVMGNLNISATGYDNATAFVRTIYAEVYGSAYTMSGNASHVTVGDINIKAYSNGTLNYNATARLHDIFATLSADNNNMNTLNNEATINIGDISIQATGSSAAATLQDISATGDFSANASGNVESISIGDLSLSAKGIWDEGNASIADIIAKNYVSHNPTSSVSTYMKDNTAEISIGNVSVHSTGYSDTSAYISAISAYVSGSANVISGNHSHITLGDVSVQATATGAYHSGQAGLYSIGAYINTFNSNTLASNNEATVAIGDINILSRGGSDATASMGSVYAYVDPTGTASNNLAAVTIGDITVTANAAGNDGYAYFGSQNSSTAAINAYAGGTGNAASISIGDITINSFASNSSAFAMFGTGPHPSWTSTGYSGAFSLYASGTNSHADITVGDISMNAQGYNSAEAAMGAIYSNVGGSNLQGDLTLGDITLTANAHGSGYVFFGEQGSGAGGPIFGGLFGGEDGWLAVGSLAGGTDVSSSTNIGDISLTATGANNTGFVEMGALLAGALNVSTDTHVNAGINVGDISIKANSTESTYANFSGAIAVGLFQGSEADITIGDISIKAASNNSGTASALMAGSLGYLPNYYGDGYDNALLSVTLGAGVSNVTVGNITMTASAYSSATASIAGIESVASWGEDSVGGHAEIDIGNISIKAVSNTGDARAYAGIDHIDAIAFASDSYAGVNIGDITLEAHTGSGGAYSDQAVASLNVMAYAGASGDGGSGYSAPSLAVAEITIGNIDSYAHGAYASNDIHLYANATSSENLATLNVGNITMNTSQFYTGNTLTGYLHLQVIAENEFSYINLGDITLSTSGYASGSLNIYNNTSLEHTIDIGNVTINADTTTYLSTSGFDVNINDVAWDQNRVLDINGNDDVYVSINSDGGSNAAVFGMIDLANFNGNFNYSFGGNSGSDRYLEETTLTNESGASLASAINFTTIYNLDLHGSANLELNNYGVDSSNFDNLSDLTLPNVDPYTDVAKLWDDINSSLANDGTDINFTFALFDEKASHTDLNGDGLFTADLGVLAGNTNNQIVSGVNEGISTLLFITSQDLAIEHLSYTMI